MSEALAIDLSGNGYIADSRLTITLKETTKHIKQQQLKPIGCGAAPGSSG